MTSSPRSRINRSPNHRTAHQCDNPSGNRQESLNQITPTDQIASPIFAPSSDPGFGYVQAYFNIPTSQELDIQSIQNYTTQQVLQESDQMVSPTGAEQFQAYQMPPYYTEPSDAPSMYYPDPITNTSQEVPCYPSQDYENYSPSSGSSTNYSAARGFVQGPNYFSCVPRSEMGSVIDHSFPSDAVTLTELPDSRMVPGPQLPRSGCSNQGRADENLSHVDWIGRLQGPTHGSVAYE